MTADFKVHFHTQPSLRGTANSGANIVSQGTSLVAQWPRLQAPKAGHPSLMPSQRTRPYVP